MRVLIVNAMFNNEAYRKSADELGAMPGIELTVLTVDSWVMNGHLEPTAPVASDSPYHMVEGIACWKGKENRGFYISGLIQAFRKSRPEVIFLMEEPFSLFALQILFLREIFAKDAPVVFFTWNNLSLDYFDYRPTIWYRSVTRWTLPRMQYALTANTDAVEVLRKNNFRGPMKSIGYGVNTAMFVRSSDAEIASLKSHLSIAQDATVLGFVGRMIEMKGLDLLVDAFARLLGRFPDRHFNLLLVGSGPAESKLFAQADRLGIGKHIRHIPSVTQTDVPKYMSLLDMLVLPSRRSGMWAEQFGRVLVEAMAMRIPAVGSSSGAIPEVIGNAGLVFEENNADDLYQKLCTMVQLSPEDQEKLRTYAEERGRVRYSWHSYATSCYDAIQEAYAGAHKQ